MDALIRSATLAPFRTRLSDTRGDQPASAGSSLPDTKQSPQEALRTEIEQQVRAEIAAHAQKTYEGERERAFTDGYTDGMAEARQAAAKDLADEREQLKVQMDSAVSALNEAHAAALSALERSVGEVAFAAVCRLIGRKAASQVFVSGLVEHACAQLRADAVATARLHPRDVHTLRELLHDHELRVQALGLKVVADESLRLGGCIIEAASGQYDGGLENQLRRLHAVLAGTENLFATVPAAAQAEG